MDNEFLEGKWDAPSLTTTEISSLPNLDKSVIPNTSMKLIQAYQAYTPFIGTHVKKKSEQHVKSLAQLINEIVNNNFLKQQVCINELIAQLFLGVKKLHEKKLVLRNIHLNTISVMQNTFGCYHLKFNIDLLALANDENLSANGLLINDCMPDDLLDFNNPKLGCYKVNSSYESITINESLYRSTNKMYLDCYALAYVIDILRLVFQRKNPHLIQLRSLLATNQSASYESICDIFYNYFQPEPIFYLNTIARKYAEPCMNLTNDTFLNALRKIKKIYFMTKQLVDIINPEAKETRPSIHTVAQKSVLLKNTIDLFNEIPVMYSTKIKKTLKVIEKNVNRKIESCKNVMVHQLSQLIFKNISNFSDEKKKDKPRSLHSDDLQMINQCFTSLLNDDMKKKLADYIKPIELFLIFMIMEVNIEKYIKKNNCLVLKNTIEIIQINFILACKLHIDANIKMEFWSQVFDVKVQRLIDLEREFLNAMDHEVIHDPFFYANQKENPVPKTLALT
jgi:hypothetical protein